ncbi:MAG: hypothetical protein AAGK32_01685 [Actinomycetota bacterium]
MARRGSRGSKLATAGELALVAAGVLPVSFLATVAAGVIGQRSGEPAGLEVVETVSVWVAWLSWPVLTVATFALFTRVGSSGSAGEATRQRLVAPAAAVHLAVTWLAVLPAFWVLILLDDALDYIVTPGDAAAQASYEALWLRNSVLATGIWIGVALVATVAAAVAVVAMAREPAVPAPRPESVPSNV